MGGVCPGGEGGRGGGKDHEAAHLDEEGNVQLSEEHQAAMNEAAAKTAERTRTIQRAYDSNKGSDAKGKAAVSKYWFEMSIAVSDQLQAYRKAEIRVLKGEPKEEEKKEEPKEEKKEEKKEEGEKKEGEEEKKDDEEKKEDGEEKKEEEEKKEPEEPPPKDPKEAHERFIAAFNEKDPLEAARKQAWEAYSEDDKCSKEKSLEFFDDLLRGTHDMALPTIEMFSRYHLKYYVSQDEGIQAQKKELVDAQVAAATEKLKADRKASAEHAVKSATKGAKPNADSINDLERAIAKAKTHDVGVEEAEKKLEEVKKKQAEAEEKKKEAEAKKKEEQDKKDAAEKEKDEEKFNKKQEELDLKKAEEQEKKDEADKKYKEALEAAGDDIEKLREAIKDGKKDKCDTMEASNKLADLEDAKNTADEDEKVTKEATVTVNAKWRVQVDIQIDGLIAEWATAYGEAFCTKQAAAFAKFFDGKNNAKEEFEFSKDDFNKTLKIGEGGGFEAYVQELGFKVTKDDGVAAVKEKIDKFLADEKEKEEKKEDGEEKK